MKNIEETLKDTSHSRPTNQKPWERGMAICAFPGTDSDAHFSLQTTDKD